MYIQAYGSYSKQIDSSGILPDLGPAIAELGIARFRRIDRFAQLCLLGSGLCNQQNVENSGQTLNPDTSIVLSSQMAGISSTVQAHQQMFIHRQPPKPANFINTLSNSAGFYVAKHLNVKGENHFLTRSGAAFEAGLALTKQAQAKSSLLGYVEECSLPLAHHRQRLGLAADSQLSEHSHWFLFTREPCENTLAELTIAKRFHSARSLAEQFKSSRANTQQYITAEARSSMPLPNSDLADATNISHALALFLQQTDGELLQCVSQDDGGFYYLLEFSRSGAG